MSSREKIVLFEFKKLVDGLFQGAAVRCFFASGAIIAEIIHADFAAATKEASIDKLIKATALKNLSMMDRKYIILHALYVYEADGEQCKVQGTLHTRESDYEDDVFTTYLNAGDAYVRLAEADIQAVLYGASRPFRLLGKKETGTAFRFDAGEIYAELETQGEHFQVKAVTETGDKLEIEIV